MENVPRKASRKMGLGVCWSPSQLPGERDGRFTRMRGCEQRSGCGGAGQVRREGRASTESSDLGKRFYVISARGHCAGDP